MAAIIMNYTLGDGPGSSNDTSFSLRQLKKIFRNKLIMLANYGYFGHMWELYGIWISTLVAFRSIGVAGGLGCVIGGVVSDKIGRSNLTISAMTISALCAIFIGFTFGLYFWLTILLALIWWVSVVADSTQFSAAVSDFFEVKSTGTTLTFQRTTFIIAGFIFCPK